MTEPRSSNFTVITRIFGVSEYLGHLRYLLALSPSTADFSIIFWAASSEFVSSSIPSWQILTAHAQPFRGARDLAFCLKVSLDSLLVWGSSRGSGETARMRRHTWTFAAGIGSKYQIRLMRPFWQLDSSRGQKKTKDCYIHGIPPSSSESFQIWTIKFCPKYTTYSIYIFW